MRSQCTQSATALKMVTRHVWEDFKEAIAAHRLTATGKAIYKRRKDTVERSFADAKELHGHRYARYRGLAKVRAQCLLAGACQNMKKIARLAARALLHLISASTRARNPFVAFWALSNSICQTLLLRQNHLSISLPA